MAGFTNVRGVVERQRKAAEARRKAQQAEAAKRNAAALQKPHGPEFMLSALGHGDPSSRFFD